MYKCFSHVSISQSRNFYFQQWECEGFRKIVYRFQSRNRETSIFNNDPILCLFYHTASFNLAIEKLLFSTPRLSSRGLSYTRFNLAIEKLLFSTGSDLYFATTFFSFNLAIEKLLFSTPSPPTGICGLSGFNLAIEKLLFSTVIVVFAILQDLSGFNLAIEKLLFSTKTEVHNEKP